MFVGKAMAGAGGSEPLTTISSRFLRVRLAKNSNPAARKSRTTAPPALTPAMAPFDRTDELLPCGVTGIAVEDELAAEVVAVVPTSGEVTKVIEAADVVDRLELAGVLELVEALELAEALDLVGELELVEAFDVVDKLELLEALDLVRVTVLVVTSMDVDFLKTAALSVLLESFAPTKSSAGHPSSQALEEQQPKKG